MKNTLRFQTNGLRAVAALARCKTLAQAAIELGVTPGAISKQVIGFERQLGRPLFERTPSGFIPLKCHRQFVSELAEGFADIDTALSELTRPAEAGLRVTVAPALARHWLIPRFGSFRAQNEDLRLTIDARAEIIDLQVGDYSCAIRFGRGLRPEKKRTLLISHEVFPVCSPGLAKQLHSIEDLANVPVIFDTHSEADWRCWLRAAGAQNLRFRNRVQLSDVDLSVDAAISGLGVAMAWQTQAIDAIQSGQLVIPFPISTGTGGGYWYVEPEGSKRPSAVTSFRDWLKGQAAASQAEFERIVSSKRGWERVI